MKEDNVLSDIVFQQLRNQEGNDSCFDCGKENPQWASINNGTFICMNCAGLHRGLGQSISKVRSLTMDSWNEKHLKYMCLGGNLKLKEFFQSFALQEFSLDRYKTKASVFYRQQLHQKVEGNEMNEEQPPFEEGREQISAEEEQNLNDMTMNNEEQKESDQQTYQQKAMASASYYGSQIWGGLSYTVNQVSVKAQESGMVTPSMVDKASYVKQKTVETTSIVGQKTMEGATFVGDKLSTTKDNIVLSSKQIYDQGTSAPVLTEGSEAAKNFVNQTSNNLVSSGSSAISTTMTSAQSLMQQLQEKIKGQVNAQTDAQQQNQNVVNIDADNLAEDLQQKQENADDSAKEQPQETATPPAKQE